MGGTTIVLALLLVLGLIGQLTRDRNRVLALLMYLPLLPIGGAALVWDVARRGRSLRSGRFVLSVLAVVAIAWTVVTMTGRGGNRVPTPGARPLAIVQWNVQWGRDEAGWRRTIDGIAAAQPDVVVLSEGPSDRQIRQMCARLGAGWNFVVHRNEPASRYRYVLAVASRWPVRVERVVPLPDGAGLLTLVDSPGGAYRVLVADGKSDPLLWRTPLLRAIAAVQREAAADVIAGDFNAMSRSVGFDAFDRGGLTLAATRHTGWRGTFPTLMPVYDIDHVWLGPRLRPVSCRMLSSPGTNHFGQVVLAERLHEGR